MSDPPVDQVVRLLQGVPFFAGVQPKDLTHLAAACHSRSYRRHQMIFKQGDPGDTLHIVLAGRVRIVPASPDGTEILLAFMQAGDFFGELSLLDGLPRSATVGQHSGRIPREREPRAAGASGPGTSPREPGPHRASPARGPGRPGLVGRAATWDALLCDPPHARTARGVIRKECVLGYAPGRPLRRRRHGPASSGGSATQAESALPMVALPLPQVSPIALPPWCPRQIAHRWSRRRIVCGG